MLESSENQVYAMSSISDNEISKPGEINQCKMTCQPESPNVTCTAEPITHQPIPAHKSEPPNVVYTTC